MSSCELLYYVCVFVCVHMCFVDCRRNSPVTAADITITNIINATSGNGIEFYVFVRGMGGDRILSQQNLLAALRVRP